MKENPNAKVAHKYRNGFDLTLHPECLDEPATWKKPRMVFVNSMSDTFHADVPDIFIHELFDRMRETPQHTYQVLTKRAERMAEMSKTFDWPANVWAGVTIENADYLHRLEHLRAVPARVRFVSFEPLLGPITDIDFTGIHWGVGNIAAISRNRFPLCFRTWHFVSFSVILTSFVGFTDR